MLGLRDVFVVLIGAVALGTAARADMMPVSAAVIEFRQPVSARGTNESHMAEFLSSFDGTSVLGLDLGDFRYVPGADRSFEQSSEARQPTILTDGQSSLSLCISALLGLGLCSSAHCLKKVHFGFIPQWYHNGGPFQIGHSLAVNPDSVCPLPVYCFTQPTPTAEYHALQHYRPGMIVSLWRKSQFTQDVLASRGPPMSPG
jgi:hypothetical protein